VATRDAAGGEQLAVELDGGEIAQACAAHPLRKGGSVRLAIRPERMRLSAPIAAGLGGTVEEAIYAGSVTTLMLRTKGTVLRIRLSAGDQMAESSPGAPLSLTWRPQDARAYSTS